MCCVRLEAKATFSEEPMFDPILMCVPLWVMGFFHPYTCMLYTVKMTLFHIFLCFRRVKRDNYLQSILEGLEILE